MSGSYKDVLARRERRRPDGSPVWPLRTTDLPSLTGPALERLAVERAHG